MSFRAERKYLVHEDRLTELRDRLLPFVTHDPHGTGALSQYTVRSIYFDTPELDALIEKIEGFRSKRKFRIRGYDEYQPGSEVFLEIKERLGDGIRKRRTRAPFRSLSDIFESLGSSQGDDITSSDDEVLSTFLYQVKGRGCKPACLVAYEREPFIAKFERDVRVTIDKNIRTRLFPELDELYRDSLLSRVWRDSFILEIKYSGADMPSWSKSMIHEFRLRRESLSKYSSAFQNSDALLHYMRI